MKRSNRKGTYAVLAAAAAGILVLAIFVWKRAKPPAQELPSTSLAERVRVPSRARKPITQAPESPDVPSTSEPLSLGPDEEPTSDDYEDNSLGDVIQTILRSDKQLDTYMYYHNRPLLDDASLIQYHKLLSDPLMLAGVKEDLLYPEEKKETQVGNVKRLMDIDYLRDAIDWAENPARDSILSNVAEIILTDNFPDGMPMGLKVSLSGNKMELYELLYDNAPDRAAALGEASQGTRLEAMIAHFGESLKLRRQLESKLENEVTP